MERGSRNKSCFNDRTGSDDNLVESFALSGKRLCYPFFLIVLSFTSWLIYVLIFETKDV